MIGENQVIGDDSSSELKSNYILMGHFSESEDCKGGIHKILASFSKGAFQEGGIGTKQARAK